jgi:hypothetical protein
MAPIFSCFAMAGISVSQFGCHFAGARAALSSSMRLHLDVQGFSVHIALGGVEPSVAWASGRRRVNCTDTPTFVGAPRAKHK